MWYRSASDFAPLTYSRKAFPQNPNKYNIPFSYCPESLAIVFGSVNTNVHGKENYMTFLLASWQDFKGEQKMLISNI